MAAAAWHANSVERLADPASEATPLKVAEKWPPHPLHLWSLFGCNNKQHNYIKSWKRQNIFPRPSLSRVCPLVLIRTPLCSSPKWFKKLKVSWGKGRQTFLIGPNTWVAGQTVFYVSHMGLMGVPKEKNRDFFQPSQAAKLLFIRHNFRKLFCFVPKKIHS